MMNGFTALALPLLVANAWLVTGPPLPQEPPPPPKGIATLDGAFWQIGPGVISAYSDEELAAEVGHMAALGMDILIIQYAGTQYDHDAATYRAYIPNTALPLHQSFLGRDPVGSVMDAAAEHEVRVILGGLLMPLPRHVNYEANLDIWTSEDVMEYRRQIVERFRDHPAFHGYYTPNEPNPADLYAAGVDVQLMIDATAEVTAFVRSLKPDLTIIQSIGLYSEPDTSGPEPINRRPSIPYLDGFWRPWVEQLEHVDVWMLIDGVGTRLSDLTHTDTAQEWAGALAREHGKDFWVDVENAHMPPFEPFTIEELIASLEVAARHGSTIVTFEYANYMGRQATREAARRLHSDYAKYLWDLIGPPADHVYAHEGIISLPVANPLALAADADGGLYVTSIEQGGVLIHIEDPMAAIDRSGSLPASPSGTTVFTVSGWPAARGLQGVQVDGTGHVYLSGDDGAGTYIRKLHPAPDFSVVPGFDPSGAATRVGGIALLGEDVLAAAAFGSILFLDTATGSLLGTVPGGTSFQREPVFNPIDNVIYAFANGGNSPALLRGHYSGGSPEDLPGFGFSAGVLVPDGALADAFGGATQHGHYDSGQRLLITADTSANASGRRQLRLWDMGSGGTTPSLLQAIDPDTRTVEGGFQLHPLRAPRDAVTIGDRIYVSTLEHGGILHVFVRTDAAE